MNRDKVQTPCDEWDRRLADRVARVQQQIERLRAEHEAQLTSARARFAEYTRSGPVVVMAGRAVDQVIPE
jgi:sulfur relay (sulfurtransferase) DsrC/TusE family protein